MPAIAVTKPQVCRYLLRYHHLTDEDALKSAAEIPGYVRKVGCIQYDPLDVVGRNPDLVLQSRCAFYKKDDIRTHLYEDRALVDIWDKNMSIIHVEEWPFFSRFRKRHLHWCNERDEVVRQIEAYLERNGSACSSDFELEERVGWHYGPQRLAKAALECMCYAGLLVVHHKKGTRRYYGLAREFLPRELYEAPDPNEADEKFYRWSLLRRIDGVGALWNRGSDAWLGIDGINSARREEAFASLLAEDAIVELAVEDLKYPLYIASENLPLLKECIAADELSEATRILAPLDNLLWDRKLVAALFDFDYRWEVYTPAPQRKYGYYVLPLLRGGRFIGRIELAQDKAGRELIVKNLWWENEPKGAREKQKTIRQIERCLVRFAGYLSLEDVDLQAFL